MAELDDLVPNSIPLGERHRFTGTVESRDMSGMKFSLVVIPPSICKKLPLAERRRLRIEGEINGYPFNNALQPTRLGESLLMLSRKMMKAARLHEGQRVEIVFEVADQDHVDVPSTLAFALGANDLAQTVWDGLTPGKRRGLAYRVASAKRPETIENRIEEVLEELMAIHAAHK